MPQLDKFIFVSQYFWLFFLFFLSYYMLVRRTLPSLLGTLKLRKMRLLSLSSSVNQLGATSASKPPLLRHSLGRFDAEFGTHLGELVQALSRELSTPLSPLRYLSQIGFPLPLLPPPAAPLFASALPPTSLGSEPSALHFILLVLARLPRSFFPLISSLVAARFLSSHWTQFYLLLGPTPTVTLAPHALVTPLSRGPISTPIPPALTTFLLRQWALDAYADLTLLVEAKPTEVLPAALPPLRAVSRSFFRFPKQSITHLQR